MTKKYNLNISTLTINEDSVETYGITYSDDNTELVIPDVSTDINLVKDLIEKCNDFELDPNQLKDVIEDSLI